MSPPAQVHVSGSGIRISTLAQLLNPADRYVGTFTTNLPKADEVLLPDRHRQATGATPLSRLPKAK
jgi:hypothetical protein